MIHNAEQKFFDALRDIFVGAEIEGQSGYINLMKIKSRYYQEGVFPALRDEIARILEPFPGFRQEMFDKLYTFFKRYFSESGSIYFRFTPPHEHVYEKVYTDDRDVALFWKTHMLYYVKTDRIFQGMELDVDGFHFAFDVSTLEHKKANEKRSLVFDFKERRVDGTFSFSVIYSERGSKTKLSEIRKAIKAALDLDKYTDQVPSEDTLERAFRIFERQSEVDYFINKNAREFLREQFHLWLYQYVFPQNNENKTVWTEPRIRQLQGLQEIAYKIIDFIAQFEDELVRIWNKPKFVLNSHYVLTLDRIFGLDGGQELWEEVVNHANFPAQMQEWRDLGMVAEGFTPEEITHPDQLGETLHSRYRYLPLDTRHFPNFEAQLIARFDHLDRELDGWLIHSENYQALNTLLLKFKERVDTIYIDPPYNTAASEIDYVNAYKDSSWLSLIGDRLETAMNFIKPESALAIAIDDYLLVRLSELLDEKFVEFERNVVIVNHHPQGSGGNNISRTHEYMVYLVHQGIDLIRGKEKTEDVEHRSFMLSGPGENKSRTGRPNSFYALIVDKKSNSIVRIEPPLSPDEDIITETTSDGYKRWYPIGSSGREQVWSRSYESALECLKRGELFITPNNSVKIEISVSGKRSLLFSNWVDSKYNAGPHGTKLLRDILGDGELFLYPKSLYLVMDAVDSMAWHRESPVVLDFFAGSGTTAHAVMNLNREDGGKRKYILVEMGEHFNDVILPRVKKVAFSDQWKDGEAQTDGTGISHFVKYYDLEQYEDTLRLASYQDADLFRNPQSDPFNTYVFLRDTKLLDNAENDQAVLEIDSEEERIRLHPERLYDNIDLAETLSCVTGKWIRRITPEHVEFEDGERADLKNLDWQKLKPLIWW